MSRQGDVIVNLLLYVPLAVLIAGSFRAFGTAQLLSTSFAILIISSMFEFAQLFVETRNFSVTDIFLNLIGGTTIAYLIYIILAHRHR